MDNIEQNHLAFHYYQKDLAMRGKVVIRKQFRRGTSIFKKQSLLKAKELSVFIWYVIKLLPLGAFLFYNYIVQLQIRAITVFILSIIIMIWNMNVK